MRRDYLSNEVTGKHKEHQRRCIAILIDNSSTVANSDGFRQITSTILLRSEEQRRDPREMLPRPLTPPVVLFRSQPAFPAVPLVRLEYFLVKWRAFGSSYEQMPNTTSEDKL